MSSKTATPILKVKGDVVTGDGGRIGVDLIHEDLNDGPEHRQLYRASIDR